MNIKSFSLLTSRCPNLFFRFGRNSRFQHFLISAEKYKLLPRFIPALLQRHSEIIYRHHSHIANQEKPPKENQSIIQVPSLQFEDVAFEQPVLHEDLIAAIKKYDSLFDQMHCLVETLSLSPEDVQKRWQFCKTIELLFKPFFNDFKIQVFGSTVNCFGFKGCDIDMTFETTASQKHRSCYLDRPDVPLVYEVLGGKVSREELSELPLKEQLLFMHSVFLEYYHESEVPAKFINAHVPLVRFYHDKYNLKCDLTMKNKVAFANTKLLYLFAKLDERVIPLMMTLRYWAKHVELIGKGLMFNTYTISLLAIYFLQTRSPPILPSAESILSLSDKFTIEDMTDESFLDILSSIPPTKNTQNLEELFKEFFFFYLYFDFTRVICPLIASAVPRDEFFSKEENSRFRMNSMCVQDPLCKPHNVAELVDYKICRKFFTEVMKVCKIFQSKNNKNVDLVRILDKPNDYVSQKVHRDKAVTLSIPLAKDGKQLTNEEMLSSAQSLLHILKHVLLFDCDILELKQIVQILKKQDELIAQQRKEFQDRTKYKQLLEEDAIPHLKNRRKKNQKNPLNELRDRTDFDEFGQDNLLEQFQNFNTNHKLILSTQCRVSNNTWMGRDLIDVSTLSSDNFLEQEQLISKLVAKQNALNFAEQNIKPFLFLFECYTIPESPKELVVKFRPLQRMSFNPILGIFLKEYVPNVMKKIQA